MRNSNSYNLLVLGMACYTAAHDWNTASLWGGGSEGAANWTQHIMISGILARGTAALFCSELLVQKQVQGHVWPGGRGLKTKCNRKGGMVTNNTHPPLLINRNHLTPSSARDASEIPLSTDSTLFLRYQSTPPGLPGPARGSFRSLLACFLHQVKSPFLRPASLKFPSPPQPRCLLSHYLIPTAQLPREVSGNF